MTHPIRSLLAGALALALATGTAMAAENKTVLTLVAQQETAWVKNFNPFLQAGLLHTTRHFIYEPLVIFNDMQGGKPVYRLATHYAFSDDLKSVTFDLREGVKWSDGEAFTADDIIFSFNLVKANKALPNVERITLFSMRPPASQKLASCAAFTSS